MTQTGGASSSANVAYSYDANGALLTDGLRHYAYDSEGRLAAASLGWSSSATADDSITKYAHNFQSQRVFKTAPLYAVTNPEEAAPQDIWALFTNFFESLWSPSTNPDGTTVQKAGMSYVYDEDGTLIAQTLTGGAQTSWGQSARYVYLPTASGPMPVAAILANKHYAIQSDHLNTPRRLIQSDGQVAWQWAYSAFGDEKPTIAKNRFANTELNQSFGTTTVPAVTFNLRYPGQYFDQETNLHYNYHRSYSATLGRYTQSDPIGLDGGWNRFAYSNQNPLSFTDPLGLQSNLKPNRPGWPDWLQPTRPNPNCATPECVAGLLPATCDNRTIQQMDDSLDKSNCKRVCKPIVSAVMQPSPVPGSSYVAKKVVCEMVCKK
jgi:RHS repeat-associated protein